MTVSSIIPVNNYVGNSSNTKFDFDFLIEKESELVVQHKNENGLITKLTYGIDYSIEEIGNKNGSHIIFPLSSSSYDVLKKEEKISLILDLPIKQESEFHNSSFFHLDVLEWTFDYLIRIMQIINRKIDRCVKVQEGNDTTADEVMSDLNKMHENIDLCHKDVVSKYNIVVQNTQKTDSNVNITNSNLEEIKILNKSIKSDIEEKIQKGIASLSNASNALRENQISNCTLKKSEKINLVFSNGVLTLKAGSEVIVPNGFENNGTNKIFNKVIVSSDISLSSPSTTQGTRFVCVTTSNMQLAHFLVDYVYSGNSEKMNTITPKQYILFYNTDTNRIYRGSSNTDGEWYAVSNISIPICKIENDSTATITALKEVYNSVAIMGSTIFADKDIEGLSPNGRNVDGSLNSTQIKTNKVLLTTITSGTSEKPHGLVVTNNAITHRAYFEQEQAPKVVSRWYNPQTNYMYTNSSSAIDTWIQDQSVLIGYVTIKDGVYTSLKINNSFRATDYYEVNAKLDEVSNRVENKVDKVQAISALMPDWNTAVSKTFTSGELYEVPYDCVLVMSVTSSSSKHLFLRLNGSDGIPIYSAYVDSAGLSRTIVDMIYLEKGTILWADVAQSGITQDNYIVALKGVA